MYFYITRSIVAAQALRNTSGSLPLAKTSSTFTPEPEHRLRHGLSSRFQEVSHGLLSVSWLARSMQATDRTLPTTQYPESCGPTSLFLAPNPLFTPNVSWIRKCTWPSTSASSQSVISSHTLTTK